MASSRSAVIQFTDQPEAQSELQFQDFGHGDTTSNAATLNPSESYTSFPDSPDLGEDETADLLSEEKKSTPSFWEFSYYQSFFDVDTDQVMQRITWSMIPLPGRATYLQRQIRPTPDLYGPFWITTTLIFSTAISANIADFFTTEGKDRTIWHYDFHKVSLAATAIYSYAFLLPLALWGLMWYRQSSTRYTLLEILCCYGYSLFIYIPISILWVIQVPWFQWLLVLIGAALSGSVLIQTFWPTVREENKKIAALVLCLILLFHTLLAVGFVAYFFQPSHIEKASTLAPISIAAVSITSPPNTDKLKSSTDSAVNRSSKIVSRNAQIVKTNVNQHPPFPPLVIENNPENQKSEKSHNEKTINLEHEPSNTNATSEVNKEPNVSHSRKVVERRSAFKI